jgi:hypothetical protein
MTSRAIRRAIVDARAVSGAAMGILGWHRSRDATSGNGASQNVTL